MKEFVTLLVPVDFSPSAKAAAHYAAQLAISMKAKIILLSVIELETSTTVNRNWKKLEKQMMEAAVKDLDKLQNEVKAKTPGVEIKYDLVAGVPMHEVIDEYARTNKVNLILMGTRGASGLKRILHGSNTATLIAHSTTPVIAIPAKAIFKSIKKIVYASDLKNVKSEVKTLSMVAKMFHAEIAVLHAGKPQSKTTAHQKVAPELTDKSLGTITYHQVSNDDIVDAISKFVDESKADMLVMFTHELDFYEKLFDTSITRSMAFQSRVPLLVYNRGK